MPNHPIVRSSQERPAIPDSLEPPLPRDDPSERVSTTGFAATVQRELAEQRLDQATAHVLQWLERRIAEGDTDLSGVQALLQHYILLICRLPPLAHLERLPLAPDDRLYECFDQFLELVRRQDDQINELLGMVAELA